MIEWVKRLFRAKPVAAPVGVSTERHLLYLEKFFTEIQHPGVSREDKARLRYAIKDRQTRLIKAGMVAPDNLAQCKSMLIAYGHAE